MGKWVRIEDLKNYIGKEVEIRGWVYNLRSSGKVRFILIRDGSGIVQTVMFSPTKDSPLFKKFDNLTLESSIIAMGKVKEEKRAPGGVEIELEDFKIVQIADEYPIQKKEHSIGFLMPLRHLWLRSRKQFAIMKIRDIIIRKIREFFKKEGFILIDAPILTPAACEGTTTLFETEYFDEKAYLSQSGQLYMEAAAMAYGKVYCFGPTFRAEKSKTRRHLIEFWMIEPEAAFYEFSDMVEVAENFVEYIVQETLTEGEEYLKILERNTEKLKLVKAPFPKITYKEAFDILEKEGSTTPRGEDFGGTDETIISSKFEKPVFVTHFPKRIKAFYMQPDPKNPDLTLSFDLLATEGYGEIIGGSERIWDYDLLLKRIEEENLPKEAFEWYLDLRKYGSVPHSGFGLGLERTIAWITGIHHIRETIPFPRTLYHIYP